MPLITDNEKEGIRTLLISSGAAAAGFARAGSIAEERSILFRQWLENGSAAGMDYMRRHAPLRDTTESVRPGAATVISMAFGYASEAERDPALPSVSRYAWGQDYHDVLRGALKESVRKLTEIYPGAGFRVCIDSAPVDERYWALEAGIGIRGRNGSVIVDGCGGYNFLVELLTTLEIEPDAPSRGFCGDCGACLKACPTGALQPDGTIDCRRCLSYLTIEHRGDWDDTGTEAMRTPAGRHTLFGCDICLRVCPHNRHSEENKTIAALRPSETTLSLTAQQLLSMSRERFNILLKGSPLRRARHEGLLRNARNTLGQEYSSL